MERLEERFKKLYEGGNDILPKLKRELEGLQDYLKEHQDLRHRLIGIYLDDVVVTCSLLSKEKRGINPCNSILMTLYIIGKFKEDYNIDLIKDIMAVQRIKEFAEKAVLELFDGRDDSQAKTNINLQFITNAGGKPLHLNYIITKKEYKEFLYKKNIFKDK